MPLDFVYTDGASDSDIRPNSPSKEKLAQSLALQLSDSMASFITHGSSSKSTDEPSAGQGPCTTGQLLKKDQESNARVSLHNKEMWDKFHLVGTEMIITKAGR